MEEHVYSEEKELSGYQSDVDRYVRSPLWLLLDVLQQMGPEADPNSSMSGTLYSALTRWEEIDQRYS